jgi:ABC-type sugar transport system ATPase subunit
MGWLNWGLLQKLAQEYVNRLEVRTPSLDQKMSNLSGGNQQKVLLGEWLATEPDILIVDEPTRGIDVGTKQEIHKLLESPRQIRAKEFWLFHLICQKHSISAIGSQ